MSESARERALRRAAEAAGADAPRAEAGATPSQVRLAGSVRPARVPNLACERGSVLRFGAGSAEVVVSIEWRDPTWAVETIRFASKSHDRLSNTNPGVRFIQPTDAFQPVGRWDGPLYPGAAGRLIPSETPATVTPKSTTQKEADMATVTRKSTKSTKGAVKAKGATTAAVADVAEKVEPGKRGRKPSIDYDGLVPQFREHLQSGGKMKALKEELGVSSDVGIVQALYRAGFDSKGNSHGIEAGDKSNLSPAKLRDFVVAERSNGTAWYVLAYRTGKGETALKEIVEEAGGPTGRVYREAAEKPAKSATKANGTGRKVTRKAAPANPS